VERVARYALRTGRPAPFVGLQVGVGALVVLVATIAGAALPPVVAAVLTFAMLRVNAAAVASTTVLGHLLVTGFLVNQFGELSWHRAPDVGRIGLIAWAAGAGIVAAAVWRRRSSDPRAVTVYRGSSTQRSRDSYIGEEIRNG
jgi:hypothetical protein